MENTKIFELHKTKKPQFLAVFLLLNVVWLGLEPRTY